MRTTLALIACGTFAALGILDLTAGNATTGTAAILLAVANYLLLT